jgi:hypothetical protein
MDGKITLPPGEENDTDTTSEEKPEDLNSQAQQTAEQTTTNATTNG